MILQTTQRLQSFGHVLSSWHRFLLGLRGRKELCVLAEEGGTQHHGLGHRFGHMADLAARGWGG